ncbi:MAG: AAA family ATPase [Ignavibacteriae bacterium]|nr:AAA family ATPase [Candidatus Scalindua sp.]MCP5064281.1 AAA family ATPase [Ignavibacteriota bacterium]
MKIGLCGTMSVGKTTLVNALENIPEFNGYKFTTERSKELMDQGIPLNTDSTLKGQCVFLAERSSELMHENIITDRTVIDVMAFSNCSTSMDAIDKEDFETLASRLIREYDYIFYVSPEGVKIENNGIRETDADYRKSIDFSIGKLLNRYRHRIKNLHTLSGSTEERIQLIKQAISL